jgi:hypothetical protein
VAVSLSLIPSPLSPLGVFDLRPAAIDFRYRYCNTYPKAIRLVSNGLIDLKTLVTHRFDLEDAVKAFHTAADPSSGAIKCQVLTFLSLSRGEIHADLNPPLPVDRSSTSRSFASRLGLVYLPLHFSFTSSYIFWAFLWICMQL